MTSPAPRLLIAGSENEFGIGRQRPQENVEPFAVFLGKPDP
jgi:hypothetical protein